MTALAIIRFTVFALFAASAIVALGSWAVRTRRINPFGRTGQAIRKLSDPVLSPIERWSVQRGGNPQNAHWWLIGGTVVGGIVVVTVAEWGIQQLIVVAQASAAGPRVLIRLVLLSGVQLLSLALVVRVIGSWFGVGRFNRWMRPAYVLTDWLVEPLRKVIPLVGGRIDITPLVAWVILQFLVAQLIVMFF